MPSVIDYEIKMIPLSKALSKSLIASASVGIIALFVTPGYEGAYRLSKWGFSGFALLLLSGAFLFSIKKSPLSFIPKERTLFIAATAFAASAIILPVCFTPFMVLHMAGALRLLMGLSFAYLTALALEEKPAYKKQGIIVILALGAFCAIIVILQAAGLKFLTNTHFTTAEFRSPGTFGNPNWAAAFLLPLVPISFALTGNSDNRREKLFYNVTTLLIIIGTIVTFSKAGILSMIGGIIIYFLLGNRLEPKVRKLILCAIALTSLAILIFAGINDYFLTLPWMRGRIFLWKGALFLIASHPFAGVGIGGFLPSYPLAAARIINGSSTAFMPLGTISFMHNEPLQIAVEGGLLTVFLYLSLIVWAIYLSYRRKEDLSRGIGAAIAALFLHGLADSPLQLPATFMLFWFLIGWMMSGNQESISFSGHKKRLQHRLKIAAFIVTILIIALLALTQGVRFTLGNLLWTKGKILLSKKNASGIEALQIATVCLPEIGQIRSDYAKGLVAAGLNSEALNELDAASKLYFNFDDVFLRLNILDKISDQVTVIEEWQGLSREFPSLVTPHYRLGLIYLEENKVDLAVAEFSKVLNLNQESGQTKLFQDNTLQILKNIDDLRLKPSSDNTGNKAD